MNKYDIGYAVMLVVLMVGLLLLYWFSPRGATAEPVFEAIDCNLPEPNGMNVSLIIYGDFNCEDANEWSLVWPILLERTDPAVAVPMVQGLCSSGRICRLRGHPWQWVWLRATLVEKCSLCGKIR